MNELDKVIGVNMFLMLVMLISCSWLGWIWWKKR